MHILPFTVLRTQARPRRSRRLKADIFALACELTGLAGLLGWLGMLFYVTALLTALGADRSL